MNFPCPKCGVSIKHKAEQTGRSYPCPKCKTAVTVPAPAAVVVRGSSLAVTMTAGFAVAECRGVGWGKLPMAKTGANGLQENERARRRLFFAALTALVSLEAEGKGMRKLAPPHCLRTASKSWNVSGLVTVYGVLTLVMPAGTPRQRADNRHLEPGNLSCQTPPPEEFSRILVFAWRRIGLDRAAKDSYFPAL